VRCEQLLNIKKINHVTKYSKNLQNQTVAIIRGKNLRTIFQKIKPAVCRSTTRLLVLCVLSIDIPKPSLMTCPCHHQSEQSVSVSHNITNADSQLKYNTHVLGKITCSFTKPPFTTIKIIDMIQYIKHFLPVLGLE
jgi:hypothetical protein